MPHPSPRIGFIGAGRLGTALAWSFARSGRGVVAVASRSLVSAQRLAEGIAGCAVGDAQAVVDASDLVFVTAPDDALAPVTAALRWRRGVAAVHCSGASELAVLAPAADAGAEVGGFHPLQSFAETEAAIASLPGCTVTIEAEEPLRAALVELAGALGCHVNLLPPGARALYHAAAGYASQFVNVLLREASTAWQQWGASEEQTLRALLPLARGTLASIEKLGVARGMPGPASRGDVGSIEKHVAALGAIDGDMLRLYRELCARSVVLALERGGIDAATAAKLRAALG
jgi:predicted short-subunit dehydrogenase-like oxidoreductase (DUF2520 family)